MGTMIQTHALSEDDYRGELFKKHPSPTLKGCHDILSITQPTIIENIHRKYLEAGADIIETNTFNANRVSMRDYSLEKSVYDLNFVSATLAKNVAREFSSHHPQKPRFVAGSIGPTNRSLSLPPKMEDPSARAISFKELSAAYEEQIRGLVEAGVDMLLIETVFDALNCKAAIFAAESYFKKSGKSLPIIISATIADNSGRLLSAQTLEAFCISVQHARPLALGLNCSFGADQLRPHLEYLSKISNTFTMIYPNAGLPNALGAYDQSPDAMAELMQYFLDQRLVNIIGGCCGTTPSHIQKIAEAASQAKPRPMPPRAPEPLTRLSGLEPLVIKKENNFINVGERTNISGSSVFADAVRSGRFDQALSIAKQQVEAGAQIIDINVDDPLLDSTLVMNKFLNLIATEVSIARVPIMLDSSNWSVLEAGLEACQGRAIVNSISLKEGEARFIEQAEKIRRYGACVMVMAFDEEGQAVTKKRKVDILTRSVDILTQKVGFSDEEIVLDPNVLAIGTGLAEHDNYAVEFFEAVRELKKRLPLCKISGGISNVSFSFRGLNKVREAIHSAFLYHAIQAGLDMGIVNAGLIGVYDEMPKDLLELTEDLIFNRNRESVDKLIHYGKSVISQKTSPKEEKWRLDPIDKKLVYAIIHGITDFMEEDIREALTQWPDPLRIIEGPLMNGMKTVGSLFSEGKMFLPQVVKSAFVMKKAVGQLAPLFEKKRAGTDKPHRAGRILMATVKGDVHDIGKNIVGVVLGCNNYEIIDLGVMTPCETILDKAKEHQVDLIGLSGLITPSLEEMIHVAQTLEKKGLNIPLMIGGATTSALHTAVKIAPAYSGPVFHAPDASACVEIANHLTSPSGASRWIEEKRTEFDKIRETYLEKSKTQILLPFDKANANAFISDWKSIPITPPSFLGVKIFENYPLEEIAQNIDWTFFFRAWEMTGTYPKILQDPKYGDSAKKLFVDAQDILRQMIKKKSPLAKGVIGLYPANSLGNDIEIYADETRKRPVASFFYLRQQMLKSADEKNFALSDLIAPKSSGVNDYMGFFALTTGIGLASGDSYEHLLSKILADRLVEAFAETIHERVRKEFWGYAKNESLGLDGLLKERYLGIRPAIGYPACPDHSEKAVLFKLLNVEKNTGISLTENFSMFPQASVCGFYLAHPQAKYFAVGKIDRTQCADYAQRKSMRLSEAEKWLAPILSYK